MRLGDRAADAFSALVGSWRFIIVQSVILAAWIALNVMAYVRHWDPYPFILLNLVLSFQAAYAAPIIMMSQNRQAAKDRRVERETNAFTKDEFALIKQVLLRAKDLDVKLNAILVSRLKDE